MAHWRKDIRDKVAGLLRGIVGEDEEPILKVFANRFQKLWTDQLPSALVYTISETSEIFSQSSREMKRTLTLAIELIVAENDDFDDKLDEHALAIEALMAQDETLGGKASDSWLSSSEMLASAEGEKQTGSLRMTYTVIYYSLPIAPDAVFDNLEKVHFQLKPAGSTEATAPIEGEADLSEEEPE